MPYSKKVLVSNTTEQLQAKCNEQNLPWTDATSRNELMSLLIKASTDEICKTDEEVAPQGTVQQAEPVPDAPEARHQPETMESRGGSLPPNKLTPTTDRCWFKVAAGQKADEKGPVFAAINGESILIHRNTWVQLKIKFLSVFSDAITSEVVILDDAKSVVRDVPRFNYETRSLSEGKPKDGKAPIGF